MTHKRILITGSTGKQGRALIKALIAAPPNGELEFDILALTRDPTRPSAQSLTRLGDHVKLVQGELDSESSLRKVFEDAGGKGSIWGIFCVLAFPGLGANADGEERQGKVRSG